jgi:hypothetical protein
MEGRVKGGFGRRISLYSPTLLQELNNRVYALAEAPAGSNNKVKVKENFSKAKVKVKDCAIA